VGFLILAQVGGFLKNNSPEFLLAEGCDKWLRIYFWLSHPAFLTWFSCYFWCGFLAFFDVVLFFPVLMWFPYYFLCGSPTSFGVVSLLFLVESPPAIFDVVFLLFLVWFSWILFLSSFLPLFLKWFSWHFWRDSPVSFGVVRVFLRSLYI
jgi:hypothetical protein